MMEFYSDWVFDYQQDDSEKIPGVVVGIVKNNWDEKHPGMVMVEFYLGEKGKNLTSWIPIVMPYAGMQGGFYALPEIGNMVVISFIGGDRNCPVVLGSMWSNTNELPPDVAQEKNEIKQFLTRGGCKITLKDTDKEQSIQLNTPKGLTIVCADKENTIQLSDKSGENCLKMDCENGAICIKAKKKIELDANGTTIVMDGTNNSLAVSSSTVDIKGQQKLTAKATNVQLTGNMVTIKSDSNGKVESGAILQIKGAMVKING